MRNRFLPQTISHSPYKNEKMTKRNTLIIARIRAIYKGNENINKGNIYLNRIFAEAEANI